MRNDLFTATRGRGAFLNDRRIRVSRRAHLRECLVGTGFPFRDGSYLDTYLQMMKTMIQQTAGLRRPGAAALDLAYVAAGFYDGFWEVGLNPWDVAAGSLLVLRSRWTDRRPRRRRRLSARRPGDRGDAEGIRADRAGAGAISRAPRRGTHGGIGPVGSEPSQSRARAVSSRSRASDATRSMTLRDPLRSLSASGVMSSMRPRDAAHSISSA